ncbi:MAG: glycosyltransferase [Candidatus Rokubacteria bacterium]|nr:glycosyltransferase [Candidatus Rokubacteria bacterium]
MARILLADYPNPDGRARFRALTELGHDVAFFDTQAPTLGTPIPTRARGAARALLPFYDRLSKLINTRMASARLLGECRKFRPDILLVIKGANLRASVLRRIRRRLKPLLVNWYGDSLLTPGAAEFVERDSGAYDFFFIIDDARALERVRVRSSHVATLPFACDPEFHRPPVLTAEERARYGSPVAFVGTVVPSREKVLAGVREFGLKIWGPPRNPWGSWDPKRSPLGSSWQGRSAWGQEAVNVYAASEIVLDIHFLFGDPLPICNVTARVFEVPACGGFLLTNAADQLGELYALGTEMVCYRSPEELHRLVAHYLAHPEERRAIAARGQRRARQEHTFKRRLEGMLEILERKA